MSEYIMLIYFFITSGPSAGKTERFDNGIYHSEPACRTAGEQTRKDLADGSRTVKFVCIPKLEERAKTK